MAEEPEAKKEKPKRGVVKKIVGYGATGVIAGAVAGAGINAAVKGGRAALRALQSPQITQINQQIGDLKAQRKFHLSEEARIREGSIKLPPPRAKLATDHHQKAISIEGRIKTLQKKKAQLKAEMKRGIKKAAKRGAKRGAGKGGKVGGPLGVAFGAGAAWQGRRRRGR